VDEYARHLTQRNGLNSGRAKHQITFQSLKDIFSSTAQDVLGEELARQIQLPALNHYLNTRILTQTEFVDKQ
jgi:hypothetical protein